MAGDFVDKKELDNSQPEPKLSRWGWLKFWGRVGKPSEATIPVEEVNQRREEKVLTEEERILVEKEERMKSALDELMINPDIGKDYYDSRYSYENVKRRAEDLPLEKWTERQKEEWRLRRSRDRDIQYTIRRIPITQNGQQGTLSVKVYPVDVWSLPSKKDKEWTDGDVQLDLGENQEGLRYLRYSRRIVGWRKKGILNKEELEDAMEKDLDGLRRRRPEEAKVIKNSKGQDVEIADIGLSRKEAIEAWDKWLPAINVIIGSLPTPKLTT